MAVIVGFLAQTYEYSGVVNPNTTSDFFDFDLPIWPPHNSEIGASPVTSLSQPWPVEANGISISAFDLESYAADFYYRIHVNPFATDVGNILGERQLTITLWNGYFTPMTITNLTIDDGEGLSIASGPALPYVMQPLEEITYIVIINTDGPAIIDAQLNWTIGAEVYTSRIEGRRSVLFPFAPNFIRTGPVETFEYLTNVVTKKTGSEQRRGLRLNPRRNFSFDVDLLDKADTAIFKNLMWGWQNRSFGVPVWVDLRTTTSPIAIGTDVVPVTTNLYGFRVGDVALLFESPTNYEVFEIKTVSGSSLTSKTNFTKAWPTHSQVYPVVLGHLPKQLPVERPVGDLLQTKVTFETSPDITWAFLPATAAATIYDGVEVLTQQPNWIKGQNDSYEYNFDALDANTGPVKWISNEIYSKSSRSYSWLLQTRQQISDMRGFIYRCVGRLKTFWVPTWSHDFELFSTISDSSRLLRVTDNTFRLMVGVDPAHQNLVIILKNGTQYYREITAVAVNPDGVTIDIEVDSTFGVTISPSDIEYISFLERCRLASDTQTFVWYSNEVVVYETKFISVVR